MLALNRVSKQNKRINWTFVFMKINIVLKNLHYFFLKLQRWAILNPKFVLFTTLVGFLLISAGSHKLQFLLSIDDLIDPDFKTYEHLQLVNREFKDKNSIILSVESKNPFQKEFLCRIGRWINSTADNHEEIIRVQSTFGIRQAEIDGTHFEMESYLKTSCDNSEDETELIKNRFEIIKKSPWYGILTTLNNYALTFNIIIHDPADKKFGSIDTQIVGKLKTEFQHEFKNELTAPKFSANSIEAYWGGILTYQSDLRNAFDQTQLLNGLMFLLCLLIFRFCLSSWKAGFIFNGTIIYTLGIVYGFMGYFQIPVDVLTNATGLMVIISCLEDFVFIIFGMLKFNWSMRKSIRRFILPGFFTSLTTAIGFGSLVTSDLGIIRRFGVISAIATLCEWFICFIVLPALIKQFPNISKINFNKKRLMLKDPMQKKFSPALAFSLIIGVAITLFLWDRITIKDSPNEFFFKDHSINKTSEHFLKSRGWVNELSLLFKDDLTPERKHQIVEEVKSIPIVSNIETSEVVKSYLSAKVDGSDKKLVHRLWESSPFSKRLLSDTGVERAQVFINGMENEQINFLKSSVNKICGNDCDIVGSLISYNEFSVRVLETLFSSLGMSLILVILILIFLGFQLPLRDLSAAIVSSLWGPLALLAVFIVFKIPLFFVSCICASVLVGLAGDNAIQFIFHSFKKSHQKTLLTQSVDQLTEASLIISFGMMLLTGVFLLSSLAPLFKLGLFILLGFVLCYLGDIWILRGLLGKGKNHDSNPR